ncbi:MAG: hypothetical protein AB7Q97_10710 [Gammaproteobacteria bacterium]
MRALSWLAAFAIVAPPAAAFDLGKYRELVAALNAAGYSIPDSPPMTVDGAMILPKAFRDALAEYLGHGFRGGEVEVSSSGTVSLRVVTAQEHRFVAQFGCRKPGFEFGWRPAAYGEDFGAVAVETQDPSCITDNDLPTGFMKWYVPATRARDIPDMLMLLRGTFGP